MICARCRERTTRTSIAQRYCPQCAREVTAIIALDARRRQPRFSVAKDLTGPRSGA